jgi:hypothetical protein
MSRLPANLHPGEGSLTFDVSSVVSRARRLPRAKVKGISINLPFLSINVSSEDTERKVAQEVLIRLRDKRVLVARECCDSCIDNALKSIVEIRRLLVDKQVELSSEDGPLFVLLDLMLVGIRQFLTFTEVRDPHYHREDYLGALQTLRGHLLRCVEQIAKLGGTTPRLSDRLAFDTEWSPEVYVQSQRAD